MNNINDDLLKKMFIRIRTEEAINLKTGKLTDKKMVAKIANIIDQEIKRVEKDEI